MKPFNLAAALKGSPVKLRDGGKAFVKAVINQPENLEYYTVIGYGYNGIHEEFLSWDIRGSCLPDDISDDDIIGMWDDAVTINGIKIPESVNTDTWDDVEFYWYVNTNPENMAFCSSFERGNEKDGAIIRSGLVFKTREDALVAARAIVNFKREKLS